MQNRHCEKNFGNFEKIAKKILKTLYNLREFDYNVQAIWVWRSLVARMNGVHEAGSSSLLTQTRQKHIDMMCFCFFKST